MSVPTVRDEWRRNGWMVVACAFGLSLHTTSSYILGLVMEPLTQEFGWTRAQISSVSLIPGVLMILFSPFMGAVIDRWGTRKVAIPSLILTGASLAMISLANGAVWQWFALWLFYGVVSLGTKVTVWTTAVSNVFISGRGLALGAMLCGGALSQILVPPIAQMLVDGSGWRMAYIGIGIGWTIPTVLLVILFMRDADRFTKRAREGEAQALADAPGLTVKEAARSLPLIRIAIATLLTMYITTALLIHQVPILVETGMSRGTAALLASLAGAAAIIGQLLTGTMTDRWNASTVAAITLFAPTIAYIALTDESASIISVVVAMMIIGYTNGSKMQISAFLTGQYAGVRNYGKIFGVMTSMIGIGGGLGSLSAGAIYDHFGSYDPLLWAGVAISVISSALMFRLPTPPKWH